MNRDPYIQSELNETAPALSSLDRNMPYSVPAGYFDTLADGIVEKVLLADGNEQYQGATMAVPEGYFDQLPDLILGRIKAEEGSLELQNVAPVLASLEKRTPYTVPAGYFEQLDPWAFRKADANGAKTVRLSPGKMMLRVAAAIVLLLSAFIVWKMSGQTKSGDAPAEITLKPADSVMLHQSLAAIDDTSLSTYFSDLGVAQEVKSVGIMLETDNIEQALSSFSESDLETQLTENPVPANESGI
jgi:hypothetical protein